MEKKEQKLPLLKASEFLRNRRPERYSDSTIVEEPKLNRSILEYHLESLTSRSEEKPFEHFARKLMERLVCPNLMPQTGPTGGGDSKTDSETYPVAEEIALRWYQGNASATERWAVAISAQKTWKVKIKKDVASIIGANRDYTRILFVTNQFVKDKERAETEDGLKKQYGVEVRIFERGWIVDKVIEHNLFNIVVDTFSSMDGWEFKQNKRLGPSDSSKEIELSELERDIADPDKYLGVDYQLAEDCLRCAILASELERPVGQVDGLFARAINVAQKVGVSRQILRFIYKRAWVYCFAYDNLDELLRQYDEVEKLAVASDDADDMELLTNLFNVLVGHLNFSQISQESAGLNAKSEIIKQKLFALSQQKNRPNNSHNALTMLKLHELALCSLSKATHEEVEKVIKELGKVLSESNNLGNYPFESYAQIILELGDTFTDSDAYEEALEIVQKELAERKMDGEIGSILTNRGVQKLRADKFYDAIKFLGKAQQYLIKDEYKHELVRCLLACGAAYKQAGLLWAARSSTLSAISIGLRAFHETGIMHYSALIGATELSWIELKLGRVPHVLFSIRLAHFIAAQTMLHEEQKESYASRQHHIDAVLAVLLLKADYSQLEDMRKLSHVLENEQLFCSEGTVLFALGEIEKIREHKLLGENSSDADIENFFEVLSSQPASEDLPEIPELFTTDTIELRSNILGCRLRFQASNNSTSILIAETMLVAIESFFATSLDKGAFTYRQEVIIKIVPQDKVEGATGFQIKTDNTSALVEIFHTREFSLDTKEAILQFRDNTHYFVAMMLLKIAIFKDIESYLSTLAEEENVFGRALMFSDALTVSSNVFGSLDWMKLSYWTSKITAPPFSLSRTTQWKSKKKEAPAKKEPLKWGKGKPPEYMMDINNQKHSDRVARSVINIPLWNAARWSGVFFMGCYPDDTYPPTLGLLFKSEGDAKAIFEDWRQRFGKADVNDEIRICFIKGIDKSAPAHYKVHISSNLGNLSEANQFIITSRINTMTPKTTVNFDRFETDYKRIGAFYLIPAVLKDEDRQPTLMQDMFILKRNLSVRWAWEIEEHDEDLVAITLDDNPIIPDGVENPPIIRTMERIKSLGSF
jgi:tetratricopeptide (TPR) repeat protein